MGYNGKLSTDERVILAVAGQLDEASMALGDAPPPLPAGLRTLLIACSEVLKALVDPGEKPA